MLVICNYNKILYLSHREQTVIMIQVAGGCVLKCKTKYTAINGYGHALKHVKKYHYNYIMLRKCYTNFFDK